MALIKDRIQQQNKEEEAYKFYLSTGWAPHQASAIVGNLKRESNFNTTVVGTADDKGSQGVAQWHSERLNKLKSMYGSNWTDFRNQLEFVNWELKNTHKSAGDALRATKGVWDAGRVVTNKYEAPKIKWEGDEKRQTYVTDNYRKYSGVQLTDEDKANFLTGTAQRAIGNYNATQQSSILNPITTTPQISSLVKPIEIGNLAEEEVDNNKEDTAIANAKLELQQKQNEENLFNDLLKASQLQYVDPNQVEDYTQQPQQEFQSGGEMYNNFYRGYINSPNYKKRLVTQGYNNPEQVKKDRLNNLNKITQSEVNDIGSQYYHPLNKVNIDNKELKKYSLNKETTTAHEYSHGVGAMNTGNSNFAKNLTLNNKETSLINSKNNYLDIDTSYNNKKLSEDQRADVRHNSLPSEAKADIDALRYKLKKSEIYDTGTQQFNQDILNKAKKMFSKDTMINRNFKAFDDKDLIWIMNNIAQTDDDQNQYITYAQQGGQIPVSSNGVYDYPNQEVIVPTDSGRITMQNVTYPILGTDEYGNRQMMFPGQEYQFQGKIIHEIPQIKSKTKNKRFS